MALYLKPPRGEIPLEKLQNLALSRLRILASIHPDDSLEKLLVKCVNDSEAVIENSPKDRISHFILRLVASKSSEAFRHFFVTSEASLFSMRHISWSVSERRRFLIELKRHVGERLLLRPLTANLVEWNNAICTMLEGEEEEEKSSLHISFHLVPDLIASRRVNVSSGKAELTKDSYDLLLGIAFKYFLEESLQLEISEPEQVIELRKAVMHEFHARFKSQTLRTTLNAVGVQSVSPHFPPCIVNLNQKLTRMNRLKHSARIGYTLFLKEIGLPYEEAVKFWSWHYSRDSSAHSGCTHSWKQDEVRYRYSIGHMYGKEGKRTNYSSHLCATVQARTLSPVEQLVCPFKAYASEELRKIVADDVQAEAEEIVKRAEAGEYDFACKLYLSSKYNVDITELVHLRKPSQLYGFVNSLGESRNQ